ncbi:MAG: hypothetical protein LBR72_06390 [Oscillospiraceae bacterium]|jgi:hypothetical protein|nr:hypothetical protein [Oscillospiraceae bacterium]
MSEVVRALGVLVTDGRFLVLAAVAAVCGISLKGNRRGLPKGARIALWAAFLLFAGLTLLLAALVVAGALVASGG